VNLVRVAYQALAAVLGGCQSLHTNAMDETLSLPSEHAATLALRTQQVLAYETGVTEFVDPLGGGEVVEKLTTEMLAAARGYFDRIQEQGGMLAGIENGFFRREIAEAAFADQQAIDAREKLIVGVNTFVEFEEARPPAEIVDAEVEAEQIAALRTIKASRSAEDVRRALEELKRDAEAGRNVFPALLEAAEARVSVQETMDGLAQVWGRYRPAAGW
jgi:methylmalonyl-CoA mutase N-terminal domain/subunit